MKKVVVVSSIFAIIVLSTLLVSAFNVGSFFDNLFGKGITGNAIFVDNDGPNVCPANQTILRLYNYSNPVTNTHGGLWNSTDYTYKICYDSIFNITYDPSSPNNCNGNNKVLGLSSTTNAHAEIPSLNNYNSANGGQSVCYGDLVCTNRIGSCGAGEKLIVSLSDNTNAHLAEDNSFANLICCSSAFGGDSEVVTLNVTRSGNVGGAIISIITDADGLPASDGKISCDAVNTRCNATYNVGDKVMLRATSGGAITWTGCDSAEGYYCNVTMNDNKTINADFTINGVCSSGICEIYWAGSPGSLLVIDKANINSTVYLAVKSAFAPGTNVNLDIKATGMGALCSSDQVIRSFVNQTDSNGVISQAWFIDDSDVAASNRDWYCIGSDNVVYFNASVATSSNRSGNLDINTTAIPNNQLNASILSPIHRQIYFKDTEILFNGTCTSDTGIPAIGVNWTIDEDGFTADNYTFNHTFTTLGQKTITFKCLANDPVNNGEQQIAILIVGSNYTDGGILGFINMPSHKQIVIDNQAHIVDVNASDSYVINSSVNANLIEGCNGGIECLAGDCPIATMNWPDPCITNISVLGGTQPFNDIYFNWTSVQSTTGEGHSGFEGYGNATGQEIFGSWSSDENDKLITLILNYNKSEVVVGKATTRIFTLGQCIDDGETYLTLTNGKVAERISTTGLSDVCKGADLLFNTSDDCCPRATGDYCTPGGCVTPESTNITGCATLTSRTSCNNAPNSIITADPLYGQVQCEYSVGSTTYHCACVWNGTTESSGECLLGAVGQTHNGNERCTNANYAYSYTSTECINNQKTVTGRLVINGTTTCPGAPLPPSDPGTITISCGEIQVPFFNAINFSITLSLAIMLYVGILINRELKKRRK